MQAKTLFLLVSTSLLTTAATASAAPAWCGDVDRFSSAGENEADAAKQATDPVDALPAIVGGLCHANADGHRFDAVFQAAYDTWSKRLALTPADWADVAAFVALDASDRNDTHTTRGPNIDKKALATYGPIDQYQKITWEPDFSVWADELGTRLTETGRAAFALRCLSEDNPVLWAMCQPDLEAIDEAKVTAEVRADASYSGAERIRIRARLYRNRAEIAKRAADVKALKAKDPGYAKMFELAKAARADWAAHLASRASLLDVTNAMDDAYITHSRKAYAGCEAKTWAAFQTAVSAIPAAKFKDAEDSVRAAAPIVDTPEGYLASRAIVICLAGQGQWDGLSNALGSALQTWPGFRGPRTATETAIMLAGIEFDDKDMSLDFPDGGFSTGESAGHTETKAQGYGRGTIAAIKPGDPSTIEFKKVIESVEDCASRKTTNKIVMIDSSGNLVYDSVCTSYTKVTVNRGAQPQPAIPRYLTALKPGMQLMLEKGVPILASAKGAKVPAVVFGVAVK